MTADSLPAYELTRNPVDGSWVFICREHGLYRSGLNPWDAINVERKHLREDHAADAGPILNLSRAARMALGLVAEADDGHTVGPSQRRREGALAIMGALVGPDVSPDDLVRWATAEADVTAAVVPF